MNGFWLLILTWIFCGGREGSGGQWCAYTSSNYPFLTHSHLDFLFCQQISSPFRADRHVRDYGFLRLSSRWWDFDNYKRDFFGRHFGGSLSGALYFQPDRRKRRYGASEYQSFYPNVCCILRHFWLVIEPRLSMAIWSQNKYIVGFLVLMTFGHWSLILQGKDSNFNFLFFSEFSSSSGVQLRATWVDSVGCVITQTNNTVLAATFIYSMCFDFIVLLLSTYKLIGVNNKTVNFVGQSRLVQMLFEDGLIFFMIAWVKIAAYLWHNTHISS